MPHCGPLTGAWTMPPYGSAARGAVGRTGPPKVKGSAADVDAGPAGRVLLDFAQDLAHDGCSVAPAEDQVAQQVPDGVAFGPFEVTVRAHAGDVAQREQDRRDRVRDGGALGAQYPVPIDL